jgi:tocopherol cyclase
MQSPAAFIRGVAHPEAFHGTGKSGGFFEGWYIKLVSADLKQRWAVIPGVFKGLAGGGEDTAFVQILDGLTGRSWFHKFPLAEFEAATGKFEVRVGGNTFNSSGVNFDLPQLQGSLTYTTALDPWPVTFTEPGIMGWYGMVPAMECFHGVVSFGHSVSGSLKVEGVSTPFEGGRGYIEKDWGKAFPAGYVWMASNHLEGAPEASLVASVAIIPWLRSSFRGFIIGFKHSGKLHKWSTYNRAKEVELAIDDAHVRWSLNGPDGRLELKAERVRGGLLHAPLRTAMYQRVEETLDSTIEIRHHDKSGKVLYEGNASCAGLEVFGDIERLLET